MMLLALRQKFRKLRFQMIANTARATAEMVGVNKRRNYAIIFPSAFVKRPPQLSLRWMN
jgi:hypothetical protein